MKKILTLLCLLPAVTAAQPPTGMNQADMQNMMARMQEVQACMAQIDQNEMNRLQQQGQEMQAEIKSLCAAGKRDEAQQRAMAYGMKIAQSPAMQQIKECTQGMQQMMAQMPNMPTPYTGADGDNDPQHVCDHQ